MREPGVDEPGYYADPLDDQEESRRQGEKQLAGAVGSVAIAGSYLEDVLSNILSSLIGNPDVDAITAGLSCDQMVQSCRVILRDNPELLGAERLKAALSMVKDPWAQRSEVVHAVWANVSDPATRLTAIKVRRWQKGFVPKRWSIAEIYAVAAELRTVNRELSACLYGIVSGDFGQTPVEDISYIALDTNDGELVVLNNLGVPGPIPEGDPNPLPLGTTRAPMYGVRRHRASGGQDSA